MSQNLTPLSLCKSAAYSAESRSTCKEREGERQQASNELSRHATFSNLWL